MLQYSCLGNPMDRGDWQAIVHGGHKSWTDSVTKLPPMIRLDFSGGSVVKECACNAQAEDPGSIPDSGRSLGEGNGSPLQHSCLANPMDRGA